ncbi:hypothetical protein MML48_8g00008264 [Holotrichia oblita]|uniref:Uncharacterized protein n=1 Tax=Holotrichia oblita TaxID=644536 RepID=A0ACB9SQB9_HOLOL|nr:hypothetical protein MML48_8g00008264 [Holotrichia oblita]
MKNIDADFKQFFKYTRMTLDVFEELLKLVKENLQKTPSKKPLSPAHRLLITLHYLAEGCSMQKLAWYYRVGKSTVHYIINEIAEVLWDKLCPIVLPEPTKEQFKKILDRTIFITKKDSV